MCGLAIEFKDQPFLDAQGGLEVVRRRVQDVARADERRKSPWQPREMRSHECRSVADRREKEAASVDDYSCAPCALIPWLLDNGPPKGPPHVRSLLWGCCPAVSDSTPRTIVS